LPPSASPKEWAEAWHELGKFGAFDESYKTALEKFTNRWVAAGTSPARQNGSAINQIRTNESALNWIWQLRQFVLQQDGKLHVAAVRNTPPAALNGSQRLLTYINANAAAITAENFVLPNEYLAGSADELQFRWSFPGLDENLRRKFSGNTCNG